MRDCEVTNIIPLAKTKKQQDRQIAGLLQKMILRSNQKSKKGSQKARKKSNSQKARKKSNSQKARKKSNSQKARKKSNSQKARKKSNSQKARKKSNSQKVKKNFRTNKGGFSTLLGPNGTPPSVMSMSIIGL